MKRRTYYAHIAGAGWIKEFHGVQVSCTPYFDKALPLLAGALDLEGLISQQFHGYRLRIVRVEVDVVTENP
jgi:hypothetical protein